MNNIQHFQSFIWNFYHQQGRSFSWRNINNAYYVLISEVMLQQTQTHRVIHKFEEFITAFPTVESLAISSLRDVLCVWQGLGYYRRARYLHQTAQIIAAQHKGHIPADPAILQTFPGIGPTTAASICAFAYNMPTVFIETNIRAVFIHSFFNNKTGIHDKELMPIIAQSVDKGNPREWYYALMDYGVHLKALLCNPSRKSAHYNKQSRFEGSDRQIRAAILKLIVEKNSLDRLTIIKEINKEEKRIQKILEKLEQEFLIKQLSGNIYTIV